MSILNPVLPDLDMGKLALYDVLEIPPQHLSNQHLFCDEVVHPENHVDQEIA